MSETVPGLGPLPSHWQLRRIKDIGRLVLGKMLQDKPMEGYVLKPYLKSKNVGWLTPVLESVDSMYFSDRELEELRLKKGDLVFAEGGEVGKTFFWNEELPECYIQNSVQKLSLHPGYDSRFFMYVSFTLGQNGYYKSIVNHVSIMHLTHELLERVEVPCPTFDEQRRIVAYLDEKTATIDKRVELLEKKKEAVARLKKSVINRAVTRGLDPNTKLKDSGVDWIGQVPERWCVRKFTHEFSFFKGLPITKADLVDQGIPVISYGQIHSKSNPSTSLLPELLRFVPESIAAANPSAKLRFGDIVFADTSEDVEGCGNCVLIDTEAVVFAGYHDIVARPKNVFAAKYCAYLFNSPSWRSQLRSRVAGIKVFSMTQKLFKGVSVTLPPLPEQRAIADYLDTECAKIDAAVANLDKQIDAYRRLKRSLIDEVVTGKRKVG